MENKDLFEELETNRLILRKIVDDDAEMLYKRLSKKVKSVFTACMYPRYPARQKAPLPKRSS